MPTTKANELTMHLVERAYRDWMALSDKDRPGFSEFAPPRMRELAKGEFAPHYAELGVDGSTYVEGHIQAEFRTLTAPTPDRLKVELALWKTRYADVMLKLQELSRFTEPAARMHIPGAYELHLSQIHNAVKALLKDTAWEEQPAEAPAESR